MRPGEPVRLRLLVLSRNLTRDRSWDIALTLDGVVTKRRRPSNRPLVDSFAASRSGDRRPPQWRPRARRGNCRRRAPHRLGLPEPFQSVAFAVNGLGGKPWRPEACARLGVISPFCDDTALSMLADLAGAEKPILIGRSDELALVPRDDTRPFRSCGRAGRDGGYGRRRGSGRRRPSRDCTPRPSSRR